MKIIFALILSAMASSATAVVQEVKGQVKQNSANVAPQQQTNPKSTPTDNSASKPNDNSSNGQYITVDPTAPQPIMVSGTPPSPN